MNFKMLQRTCAVIWMLSVFAFGIPAHAAVLMTGNSDISQLEIPSITLSVPVVVAHFTGTTWDFSNLNDVAGYFEGLPMPGDGSNAIIGAHSELDNNSQGPFYNLDHVQINDQIYVTRNRVTYTYVVTKTYYVLPTDISPISPTKTDTLTLLTCAGYDQGVYTTRLVVRAELTH